MPAMEDEPRHTDGARNPLEEIEGPVVVPQANNLAFFIRMHDEVAAGRTVVAELAEFFDVQGRTIHYYADFGRWLGFYEEAGGGQVELTAEGRAFADRLGKRGALFQNAVFARPLARGIQKLRDAADEELELRDACIQAIAHFTDLSDATVRRRASGLTRMLQAAYEPWLVDWETGEALQDASQKVSFEGRTFLTAMEVRQFGTGRRYQIAFPHQVRRVIVDGDLRNEHHWSRASYELGGRGLWFGSVPLTRHSRAILERGGSELRKILTITVPYITLAVTMLTLRDSARRPAITLSRDMYGLRLWHYQSYLGNFVEMIEQFARDLGLRVVRQVPHLMAADSEIGTMGSAHDLIAVLEDAGMVTFEDTRYTIAPEFIEELSTSQSDTPSVDDRLGPMQRDLRKFLPRWVEEAEQ
jgi:hypothetical protein